MKRNSILVLVFTLLIANNLDSQGIAKTLEDIMNIKGSDKTEKQLDAYLELEPVLKDLNKIDTLADVQYLIGNRYLTLKDTHCAKVYRINSLRNFSRAESNNPRKHRVKTQLAAMFGKLEIDSALFYLDLINYEEIDTVSTWVYSEAVIDHATLYDQLGEYHAAYLLTRQIFDPRYISLLGVKDRLRFLKIYIRTNYKIFGGKNEKEILEIFNSDASLAFGKDNVIIFPKQWANLYLEIFNYFEFTGQYQKALDFVNKYLEKYKKYEDQIPKEVQTNFYTNKLNILDKLGKYTEMPGVIEKILSLGARGSLQNEIAFRNNYAVTLMHQQDYEGALQQIEFAFDTLGGRIVEITNNTQYTKDIIALNLDELRIHLHFNNVEQAIESKLTVLKLINDKLEILALSKSHLAFKSELNNLTDILLDAAIRLDDPALFWQVCELNKATLTLKNLEKENTNLTIRALQIAKDSIAFLEIVNPSGNYQKDLTQINQSLLDEISKNRTSTSHSKINISSIPKVQKKLSSNQCVVSYQWAKNMLYAIVIKANSSKVLKLDNPLSIAERVGLLTNALTDYNSTDYLEIANEVRQLMWEPLQKELTQEVVVIPDGSIAHIPFDLIDESGRTFSYSLSGTLWMKTQGLNQAIRNANLCAPDYGQVLLASNYTRSEITPLKYSKTEVDSISKLIHGEIIDANKSSVKESIVTADLFHFSGHGVISQDNSNHSLLALSKEIQNYKNILSNGEISNLDCNAAMVVLSACETGIGESFAGEGMNSLTKGFIQAGAASVVQTLWKVNDKSTSQIMTSFYKYIKQGDLKSVALDKAKLDYRTSVADYKKHPHYWAGIVVVGNNAPLHFKNTSTVWWWLIGIVVLASAIFWYSTKKNTNPSIS